MYWIIRTGCIVSFSFIVLLHAQGPEDYINPVDAPMHLAPPGLEITKEGGTKGAEAEKNRFTIPTTTKMRLYKISGYSVSFKESCDYGAHFCLKTYVTGKICARTLYYATYTFKNYCLLDYVNCMERYEMWQIAHMGECFDFNLATDYTLYRYENDHFLDEYYIAEDH